jgi:hypothetical protein
LPAHLRADFERACKDQELHSLHKQIALLSARELELIRGLGEDESPPWGRVVDALVDYERSLAGNDAAKREQALANLKTMLRQGAEQAQRYESTWHKLQELFQEKSRLTTAESKREQQLNQYVALTDLLALLTSLMACIRENVPDVGARQRIQDRYRELVNGYAHRN